MHNTTTILPANRGQLYTCVLVLYWLDVRVNLEVVNQAGSYYPHHPSTSHTTRTAPAYA